MAVVRSGGEVKGAALRGTERGCCRVVSGEGEGEGEGRRWRRGPSSEGKTKHDLSRVEKLGARWGAYAGLLQRSK